MLYISRFLYTSTTIEFLIYASRNLHIMLDKQFSGLIAAEEKIHSTKLIL